MIISRTPFRISFFGGGTDYPAWYRRNGGAVLSTSIDKYTYITCRELPPFFEHRYRIAYSKIENARILSEIEHPAVRAAIQEVGVRHGLEIHCDADLPARAGLGSSSAFVVGLLHALKALQGLHVTRDWLAREAIRIEQDVLNEAVGSQDQMAAAHGGLNLIEFRTDGDIRVSPIALTASRKQCLADHLMLFFTGVSRFASTIAAAKIASFESRKAELLRMRELVDEGLQVLAGDADLEQFGLLLNEAWQRKRSLASVVSTELVDDIYARALRAGALGGKLLGAGGGGFMLFFVPPERQAEVCIALEELVYVPIGLDRTGSTLIHYQPEQHYLDRVSPRREPSTRINGVQGAR